MLFVPIGASCRKKIILNDRSKMVEKRNWVCATMRESKTFASDRIRKEKRGWRKRERTGENSWCAMLGAPWCARCARSRSVKIHPWARAACRCLPLSQKPTKAIPQRKSRGRGISFSSACRPCSLGFNRLESKDRAEFVTIAFVLALLITLLRIGLISNATRATSSATVSTGIQQRIIFLARISCSSLRFFSIDSKSQRERASVSGDAFFTNRSVEVEVEKIYVHQCAARTGVRNTFLCAADQ